MSDSNNRRHPESTFEATYPYNQSTITRSGHEIHINDTPEKESLRVAHTKGSYVEIDKAGRTVINSVGKAYYYMCDGFTTTVDGHYDLKVKGVMNVNIDGSVSEQTEGNRYMAAGGDFVLGAGGNLSETIIGDKYESVGGNETVAIRGSEYKSVSGDSATSITGVKAEVLNDDWSVNSGGNIEIISTGNIRFKCKNFEVEADSITLKTIGGDVTITSSAQVISTSAELTRIQSASEMEIGTTGGDITIDSSGKVISSSAGFEVTTDGGNVTINSSGQVSSTAAGQTTIASTGQTLITGNPVNFNP
jgi:hypothetical protein